MTGIVKWFSVEKGYGFIDWNGIDIYVHYTSILDQEFGNKNLINGEMVNFNLVKTRNGYRAKNVRTII